LKSQNLVEIGKGTNLPVTNIELHKEIITTTTKAATISPKITTKKPTENDTSSMNSTGLYVTATVDLRVEMTWEDAYNNVTSDQRNKFETMMNNYVIKANS
jgi:hypothetical protein